MSESYEYHKTTRSVCPVCHEIIPAKVIFKGAGVYLMKHCRVHGDFRSVIERDRARYLESFSTGKPAVYPLAHTKSGFEGCGRSCGLCAEHQQHTCLPIIEITDYCNMTCPVCLVDNAHQTHMSVSDFSAIIESLIRCEGTLDLINLSGGEPTMHPDLLRLIDLARRPEIVNCSISTNGRIFLKNRGLLDGLIERGVFISLQFDGFDDRAYREIRGEPLLEEKHAILELLERAGAKTSLVMTVVRGVNDREIARTADFLMEHDFIKSLMIQPIVFTNPRYPYTEDKAMTTSDVVRELCDAKRVEILPSDITNLPCSHPTCFSLAYFLKLKDRSGFVPLTRLVDSQAYLDVIKNRTTPGLDEESFGAIREKIYQLWSSSGSIPESEKILATIRDLLCELGKCGNHPTPQSVFSIAENAVKSIYIHSFMDAHTMDLARVMKCCTQYPTLNELTPCCMRNAGVRGAKAPASSGSN
ncbi:MAG TPA: radical SAM protein [Bacteroidota bacterium]|nr:radical SAM protein [Bacteroidota bacterium]